MKKIFLFGILVILLLSIASVNAWNIPFFNKDKTQDINNKIQPDIHSLEITENEWIETPYMRVKLSSTIISFNFKDGDGFTYWIQSELKGATKQNAISQHKKLKWINIIGEDIDIEQEVYDNRIKESIIINKKGNYVFQFKLTYSNELIAIEENSIIVFKNKKGDVLVEIEEPFAIDASGKYYQYKYSLVGNNLKLEPVDSISGAVYPLIIDPSYFVRESIHGIATNSDRGLARTSNGDLHVVYTRKPTDSYTRPCYARSTDNGHTWTEEQVLTTGNHHEYEPSIAVDSENNLHVIWEGYVGGYAIAYAKYNGTAWSTPISIGDELSTVGHPSIAIDISDNIHVVWHDTFNGHTNIRYIKYNGTSWSSITDLTSSGSYNRKDPSIIVDYDNNLHVVWDGNDSSRNQIYHQRSTTSGESWDAAEKITSESYNQYMPQIAVGTDNILHVAFAGYGSWGVDRRIRYKKYDGSWSGIVDLDAWQYYQDNPTISVSQVDNTVDVVWYGRIDATAIYKILHNQYNGTAWGGNETIVEVYGEDQQYPTSIMAVYPDKCEINTNVPYTGFAFIYTDNFTVRYYEDSELSWLISGKHDLTVKARDSVTDNYINNFTADLSTGDSDSTTDGTITFSCIDENQWITIVVTADDYHINSKDTYLSSDKTETLLLTPIVVYNLTVKAKNSQTSADINNFTVNLSTGDSGSTTTGSITFSGLDENQWITIVITADDYYTGTKDTYLSSDKTETLLLNPSTATVYNLTVKARSFMGGAALSNFTVELDTGEINVTTDGSANFSNILSGYREITVTSVGYYPQTKTVYLDTNKTEIVYLTPITEEDYYPPISKKVEFRVIDTYFNSISDINVTVTAVQHTFGSWSWLYEYLGFSEETYGEIQNTTMAGDTDSKGTVVFFMVEGIKYKVNFNKTSQNIDETLYIYPKESQYLIILTPPSQPMMTDYLNWNLSIEEIVGDSANRSLNFTYTDAMDKTSQICFFVKDENKTEIYSNCSFADNSSVNTGYTVAKIAGATYYWGFNATHDTFGDISGTKTVTFTGRLIDLQLDDKYYTWISIALLVMISSLFSAVTVKFGYVVLPMISAFFVTIGWLEIAPTLITVIVILGILLYLGKRERESGL